MKVRQELIDNASVVDLFEDMSPFTKWKCKVRARIEYHVGGLIYKIKHFFKRGDDSAAD